MQDLITTVFEEHITVTNQSKDKLASDIEKAGLILCEAIKNGNKILLFGNGGSAADAQHIAAEFTGRFVKERRGLPAIAITTDTSALTAIGNDYGYEKVFERQIEALARPGDVLIGISTSGNSGNVIKALVKGKELGCSLIGFSGRDGGEMNDICDFNLIVPSDVTARIQEVHILVGHLLCQIVDDSI